MFCPNCFYEYKEGVKKCPDCNIDLVTEDPIKDDGEGDLPDFKVAELCDIDNEIEVQILRDMLTQEGIYSFFRSNVLPHTNVALGFFARKKYGTIIVNLEDLEKAREVLNDFRAGR
jgi:hypothetical protein